MIKVWKKYDFPKQYPNPISSTCLVDNYIIPFPPCNEMRGFYPSGVII